MLALVQRVVQQVLEAEMTSFLGAENYERTSERRGYRNGYKPRLLKVRVGELELLVPKDRDGQFQTELLERYQRSEKALVLAIMQMYVEGVSTRKVRDIAEALCGLEIGKSHVSALAARRRAPDRNSEEDLSASENRGEVVSMEYAVVIEKEPKS